MRFEIVVVNCSQRSLELNRVYNRYTAMQLLLNLLKYFIKKFIH